MIHQLPLGDFLFILIIINFAITNYPIFLSENQGFGFQVLRQIEKSNKNTPF